jgi:CHAT domain-containing protein/tetratricopeptide (TPR) repeat protein
VTPAAVTRAPTLGERVADLCSAGVAANEMSRPGLAVRHLRAGLRLLDANPTDPALLAVRGRLLVSLAWAESERGRADAGFRLLREAEPLLPPGQRPVLYAQRALLLERTGRNDLALREYDAAVALLSARDQPLDLVKALNNRAVLHEAAGHSQLARADLRRCGRIAAEHGMALVEAICRSNLGGLAMLAGDLPGALQAFGAARRNHETLAPGRLSGLAVERARALVAAGLFSEADRELAAAIEEAGRQGLRYVHADALQVRAEAALLAGQPAAAAAWARQARARFQGRDNARRAAAASLLELRARYAADGGATAHPTGLAGRAAALATRLNRLGLPEDARVAGLIAARALAAAGRLAPAERIARLYGPPRRADRLDTRLLWRLTRAELATAAGRSSEASRHLVAGMTALHRHRAQMGCLDLQTGAAVHGRDLARAGLGAAVVSGSPAAVYRWSERARAQALLLPPVRPPGDPAAAAALEELRQVRHALRDAELTGRPDGGLRTRAEALQRTVREHSWSAPAPRAGGGGPELAPLAATRAALSDAALAVYLRDDQLLWALVITGRRDALVPLGRYADAEEAVLRLRADLDSQAGRAMPRRLADAVAEATRADARAVAAVLIDPLLSHLRDRDLVVVPTGVLLTVPWSVLPGCAGRPVTVAPSATAWLTAAGRLRARPPNRDAATLLVAGPGNNRGDAEVRAIARLRPHTTVLLGEHATPAATLAALDSVTVAHLAVHGHHQSENALFSALELAGGPLMGYDVEQLARTPSMVVLSSCDLALTDIRPGDETFGLATALLNAGSATVVASVCRIADETAVTAMTGYHRAVAAGHPPATALAAVTPAAPLAGFICFGAG